MNVEKLQNTFFNKKDLFHSYIKNIKENMVVDIFSIINTTLICNPYNTSFPKKFFLQKFRKQNKIFLFIKSSFKFYIKQFYFLSSYLIAFILFKIYYKKKIIESKNYIFIDVFFLVDRISKDNKFNETYFNGLYNVLNKYGQDYVFLPRLYGINKNPFKMINFFKIINKDKRNFLFEFELLSLSDFISILYMILVYPFKTLRLLQKNGINEDKIFNNELVNDIKTLDFNAFSRYVYGQNIAKVGTKTNRIYSWSEFQVIERSFNYAIRKNSDIKIYACQFFINNEIYFNSYIEDIDYINKTSSHEVLVNGKHFLKDTSELNYLIGISLRYKNIFSYQQALNGSNIVLLGSYIEDDTKYMLNCVKEFDKISFKNHPTVDINNIKDEIGTNIELVEDNMYDLFKNASVVIGTAFSGTSVEAVACGVSVIIIASQNNLTGNPLIEHGKGKIWDIAFSKDEVNKLYHKLTEYRKNNIEEIQSIASWYKSNFFVEPTEKNIIKAFELDKE